LIVENLLASMCTQGTFILVFGSVRERQDAGAILQFSGRHAEGVVHILGGHKAGAEDTSGTNHKGIDCGQG
jgi:hypothetical protein